MSKLGGYTIVAIIVMAILFRVDQHGRATRGQS